VKIKKLNERLSVSPQVLADNMDAFMPQGFHAINCNRLDGDGSYQPCFTEIERAMQKHGFEAVYIPVVADKIHSRHGRIDLKKPIRQQGFRALA
jgi:sulfide:quinone oxidoreductase